MDSYNSGTPSLELSSPGRQVVEMATTRGSQTMNTMFFKPMIRKAYHRKSSPPDLVRETMKMEAEEVRDKSHQGECSWVPHEKTGIYYPKGQEKVIEDVPSGAAKDIGVNWFYHNH